MCSVYRKSERKIEYKQQILVCVENVSDRAIARKLEREQKQKFKEEGRDGGGEGKRKHLPLPLHTSF